MAEKIKKKISELKRHSVSLSLISLALIIAISGMFAINGTLGWYAHNDEVSAGGLAVSSKVSPNLIIAKTEEAIKSQSNLQFNVDFNGTSRNDMIAVTRDENVAGTFLKYIENPYAVSSTTGLVKDGYELRFLPVTADNTERYFIDHIVYIASAFAPLDVESLTATITIPVQDVDLLPPYYNAASIDFYVGEVSLDNYCGTASVANREESVPLLENGTVPLNTKDSIKVIMRCYFDGALEDGKGTAYVNSYSVDTDGVVIGVEFNATETVKAEEN